MFRAVLALRTILLVLILGQTRMEALDVWLVVRKPVDFVVQENFRSIKSKKYSQISLFRLTIF